MRELIFPHDSFIDMDELKVNHLRLDPSDIGDDAYIGAITAAALQHVSNDIDRTLYPASEDVDLTEHPEAITLSSSLKHAVYLLVATWYENRESITLGVNATKTPHAYDMLIQPYRNNGFLTVHGGVE